MNFIRITLHANINTLFVMFCRYKILIFTSANDIITKITMIHTTSVETYLVDWVLIENLSHSEPSHPVDNDVVIRWCSRLTYL